MPNITAYLTVGKDGPFSDFYPTYWGYLVENPDRPIWYIGPSGVYDEDPMFKGTWPTSRETVLDDAMIMIARVVEEVPAVCKIIDEIADRRCGETVDLQLLEAVKHYQVLKVTRAIEHKVQLVFTILKKSIMVDEYPNVIRYKVPVQVCLTALTQNGSFAKLNFGRHNPELN